MKAVYVFFRVDGLRDFEFVDVFWKWQLNNKAIDTAVLVEAFHFFK